VKTVFTSWLGALIASGVLEDDARRTTRGIQCLANDGHVCLSLGEKTIDDFLFSLNIAHEKEPKYPVGNYRGDFKVGNIFIEYFGLSGDRAYDQRSLTKRAICKSHGIELIEITPKDLTAVSILRKKFARLMPTGAVSL
jgi:hypothetical protein